MPVRVPTAPSAAKRGAPARARPSPSASPADSRPNTGGGPHTARPRVGTAPHKAERPSPYAAPVARPGGGKLPAIQHSNSTGSGGMAAGSAASPVKSGAPLTHRLSTTSSTGGSVPTSMTVPAASRDFEDDDAFTADLSADSPLGGPSAGPGGAPSPLNSRAPPLATDAPAAAGGSNITPDERDALFARSGAAPLRGSGSAVATPAAAYPAYDSRDAVTATPARTVGAATSSSTQNSPNGPFRLPSRKTVDGQAVSAFTLIEQLDGLRNTCVEQGRLLEAQQCLDEMRTLATAHGERVARELKAPKSTEFAKRQLQERHRDQMLKFTSLWESRMVEFERQAEQALRDLRARRQREYEDLEDVIRSQLAHQRPHFSSQVVNTKKELEKLIRTSKYADAHRVKGTLEAMIDREERRFEELTSVRFAQQTRALKRRFVSEVKALRMRINNDREQLVGQRQNDHETLMQRQANEVIAFEQRVKTEKAKAMRLIERRLQAMQKGEGTKHVFDLKMFDRIAENALADVVGAPPDEAADAANEDQTSGRLRMR